MAIYPFLNALKQAKNAQVDAVPKFADKCQIESYRKQGKTSLIIRRRYRPTSLPYASITQGVKGAKDAKMDAVPKFVDKSQIESDGKPGKISLIIRQRYRSTPLPYNCTIQGVEDAKHLNMPASSSYIGAYMRDYIIDRKIRVNEIKYELLNRLEAAIRVRLPKQIQVNIWFFKIEKVLVIRV